MHPHRKLLVLGLNHILSRRLLNLWDEGDVEGHTLAELVGKPSAILWTGIGSGEVRLSVWWDYDHGRHPQAEGTGPYREQFNCSTPLANPTRYREFVGTMVSGWVERKTGRHLQGHGNKGLFDIYTRRDCKDALAHLPPPQPFGFSAEGQFFF